MVLNKHCIDIVETLTMLKGKTGELWQKIRLTSIQQSSLKQTKQIQLYRLMSK